MKSNLAGALLVISIIFFTAGVLLASGGIIGSSGNGESDDANSWLLLGRTRPVTLSVNGKVATVSREIVCRNQTVENGLTNPDPTLAGSCYDGVYMYLFQVRSRSAQVEVKISGLSGFDAENGSNYGVVVCDDANIMELCTNAPASSVPNFAAVTTKDSVSFRVPGVFPRYPSGTPQEGEGLTFYVVTNQATPLPIAIPEISVH
jgi:hypothetical protein